MKFRSGQDIGLREKLFILGVSVTVAVSVIGLAFYFMDPLPPRRISIGCGPPESATYRFAQAYQDWLARDGITLNLQSTAGSVENLKLMETESDGVDVAFVQGSVKSVAVDTNLVSLGSLFFEPLWIFHRQDLKPDRISDLKGLRLAVGKAGGGTRILAIQLLELNGINNQNSGIFSFGFQEAVDRLLNGEVDVAFFVSTHRTDHILELVDSKSVKLMGVERAEAYALLYHYLYVLKLPEGVIDFEANIPSQDLNLVAPTTQLVARPDLHPALVYVLLEAAKVIHRYGGEFEREGEFPAPKYLDFKLSPEAERFYKTGPPFLLRYLPFWIAILVRRLTILLLPVIAVIIPLFKLMPLVYRWRMRSRIYRWYSKLRAFDPERHREEGTEQLKVYLNGLEEIEKRVSKISVPLAFSEELYHLRMHIDMLRTKLSRMIDKYDEDQSTRS